MLIKINKNHHDGQNPPLNISQREKKKNRTHINSLHKNSKKGEESEYDVHFRETLAKTRPDTRLP